MRVIADHARTTALLLSEGVMPDRGKREYVLRRVMRRAIRHGQRLGIERPFLHEVALQVVDRMGSLYPALRDRRELIARVTEDEEVRFRQTLKRGLKILEERFDDMRKRGETTLAADSAADMYTTYGFPLDLTDVICRENSFELDVPGAEKIIAGAEAADGPIDPNAAVDSAYRDLRATLAKPVAFTGYDNEEGKSVVLGLIRAKAKPSAGQPLRTVVEAVSATDLDDGDLIEVVVASTPFYAESGGQVGDAGEIHGVMGLIAVSDTQRPLPGLVVHMGTLKSGSLRVGEEVVLKVDHEARSATRRNHSATHVLHWALRSVLGEHAQQKGSRVGPDILRFDFTHNKPLAAAEIVDIEDRVNKKLLGNAPVKTEILPIDEAKKRGAMAIFEEKYGDTVRMLTMTPDVVELCGGTHARALGDIGLFKIVSEGGVAAGVRRILGVTGLNALSYVREAEGELDRARTAVKGGDVVDKIGKLVARERELEKKVADLERKVLEGGGSGGSGGIEGMLAAAREIAGVKVLAKRVADGTTASALRDLAEKLRDKLGGESAVLLGAATDGKAQLAVMVSKPATARLKAGDLIKSVAAMVGGRGGGRPDMAQAGGNEVDKLDAAVAATFEEAEKLLTT